MDLLDFYRGTLSIRKLGVLIEELPRRCALNRALNGGQEPWTLTDHLLADLWSLFTKKDHPVRARMVAKFKAGDKSTAVAKGHAKWQAMKQKYGLE